MLCLKQHQGIKWNCQYDTVDNRKRECRKRDYINKDAISWNYRVFNTGVSVSLAIFAKISFYTAGQLHDILRTPTDRSIPYLWCPWKCLCWFLLNNCPRISCVDGPSFHFGAFLLWLPELMCKLRCVTSESHLQYICAQ